MAYPSLPSSPYSDLAAKYFPRGSGAILGVRVRGGLAAAKRVLEKVRIFDYMVNVGDTKSMIVHPATSIHHGIPAAEQRKAGVFEDTLRISVGTEDAGDSDARRRSSRDERRSRAAFQRLSPVSVKAACGAFAILVKDGAVACRSAGG